MGVEGIVAVQQRVAAVEARLAALSGVRPPPAARAATTAAPAVPISFERVLAQVAPSASAAPAAPAGPAGLTPATLRRPGAYARVEPPAELRAYGNGRIPAAALTPLGEGGHRLWAPAAQAFRHMAADARAAGVDLKVTDSYRPFDQQVAVARKKGLYKHGGLAAVPGTSAHGWGLAVDLSLDAAAQRWVRANGHRYGFVEDTPREPWHWTYRPD